MSWETNPYDNPGKYGLTIVGEAEVPPCYDFDKFVVWRDGEGQLYYATDSGCSCPSPFEGFDGTDDLTKATVAEVHAALDEWASASYRNVHSETMELHAKLAALRRDEEMPLAA